MKKIICIALLLTGCATLDKAMTGSALIPEQSEREKIAAADASLSATQRAAYIEGRPPIGVTKAKLAALFKNEAERCKRTTNEAGEIETCWLSIRYGSMSAGYHSKTWLLAFRDGKLSTVQDN